MSILARTTIRQKGILLVSIPLVCQLLTLAVLGYLVNESEIEARKEARGKAVTESIATISGGMTDYMSALALYWMTRDKKQKKRYEQSMSTLMPAVERLKVLCKDDPEELKALEQVEKAAQRSIDLGQQLMNNIVEGGGSFAASSMSNLSAEAKACLKMLSKELLAFKELEEARAGSVTPVSQEHFRAMLKAVVVVAVVANILLAIGIAISFSRGIVERLQVLSINSMRIGRNETLLQPIEGSDEIAQLDGVLHRVAGELKTATEMRQQFVAMITHDLRAPLTSLQLLLESLVQGIYGQQPESALPRIRAGCKSVINLIDLINDLLDVERAEAGHMQLTLESLDISEIIDAAVESVDTLAAKADVTLGSDVSDVALQGDRRRLIRVVQNLLSNAIKFSKPETTVTVKAKPVADGVEVHVVDQGSGIDPAYHDMVFVRYKQVHLEKNKHTGTGLGLANCKAIVESHGGTIGLTSELGKGSDFWFRIPLNSASITVSDQPFKPIVSEETT